MRGSVLYRAIIAAFAVVAIGFAPEHVVANIITIDATDSGWYNSSGYHDSTNKNYIAGFASPTHYNNYFVFDLTGVQSPISSAVITLYMPITNVDGGDGYVGPASVFSLQHVLAPSSEVMKDHTGLSGQVIYADLGTGTVLGSKSVSTADNGTIVSIDLNADGIALLNAGIGGLVTIGGTLATLDTLDQYTFGWSGETSTRQVLVATVPEPLTVIQLGIGLSGLFLLARRRARIKAKK